MFSPSAYKFCCCLGKWHAGSIGLDKPPGLFVFLNTPSMSNEAITEKFETWFSFPFCHDASTCHATPQKPLPLNAFLYRNTLPPEEQHYGGENLIDTIMWTRSVSRNLSACLAGNYANNSRHDYSTASDELFALPRRQKMPR